MTRKKRWDVAINNIVKRSDRWRLLHFVIRGCALLMSFYVLKNNYGRIYYINTNKIPHELSRENKISSHVKYTWKDHRCYAYIISRAFRKNMNKKHIKGNGYYVFYWWLCNKYNITGPLGYKNFLFSCWKVFHEWAQHSKRNFVFARGYVMFSARCMNASTSPRFCYVYFNCILLWLLTYSAVKKYERVVLCNAWSLSYCLVWSTHSLCSKSWPMNA